MRYLFVLLLLVGCGDKPQKVESAPSCESILNAVEVNVGFGPIPDNYSGAVKRCLNGRVVAIGEFLNGEENGVFKQFDNEGQLEEYRECKEGLKNGEYRQYINGSLQKQWHYINDTLDGVCVTNKWDGTPHKTITYKMGVVINCEGDCD